MKFFKNKKGFTLVELVVVIAILGILAGIAIPRFMDATASARGAKIVADMRTIDSSIMMYSAASGKDATTVTVNATGAPLTPSYLAAWPVPPSGDATIVATDKTEYKINTDAASYTVVAGRCEITGATGTNAAAVNGKSIDEIVNKAPAAAPAAGGGA